MAKDIHAVVEALQLDRLVLIGWSLAVPQVVNYALHFGNLRGLVLVDGIVGTDPSLPFYALMKKQWEQFEKDRASKTETFIKSIFKQPHS